MAGWERDYWRSDADSANGASRGLGRPFASIGLLAAHLTAFPLILAFPTPAREWMALSGDRPNPLGILLHPLASPSPFAILLTVATIWFVARRLETLRGSAWIIASYVSANTAAGAVYFAAAALLPRSAGLPLAAPIGALAAWCVAVWMHPVLDSVTIFGRSFAFRHVVAFAAVASAAIMLSRAGVGGVAWLAALAVGAASPIALARVRIGWPHGVTRRKRLKLVRPSVRAARSTPPRSSKPVGRRAEPQPTTSDSADVDAILEKISRSGMSSLTADERERLEAARRDLLRGPE